MAGHQAVVKDLVVNFSTSSQDSAEVKEAAEEMAELIAGAFTESTGNNYEGCWKRFQEFCVSNGRQFMPASIETVALYLVVVAKRGESISPALSARAAISYYHKVAQPEDIAPTEAERVKQVMAGLKKKYAKPVVKKKPVTPEIMKALLRVMLPVSLEAVTLIQHRLAAFTVLLFFGCARYEEVVNVKVQNVKMTDNGNMEVIFKKAKNNKFGQPRKCIISNIGGDFCPVGILQSYLEKIRIFITDGNENIFLFPNLSPKGIPMMGTQFSYDNAIKRLRSALMKIGFTEEEAKTFGLHSPRIGFASAAFAAGKFNETEVQMAGRWLTEHTPRTYNVADEETMGRISKHLGEKMANH